MTDEETDRLKVAHQAPLCAERRAKDRGLATDDCDDDEEFWEDVRAEIHRQGYPKPRTN